MKLSLTFLDLLVLFSITVVGCLFAATIHNLRMQMKKRKLIDEFLDYISNKVKTDEEFNDIVSRLRRDFE